MNLKPIETIYNGYKFRSRLEARWAVFFDELKIEYQYEVEGFNLHYSGWYLPDFYLPLYQAYMEIKPFPENPLHRYRPEIFNKEASQKTRELSLAANKWIILAFGEPLIHRACWFIYGFLEFPDAAICFEEKDLAPTFYENQILEVPCSHCYLEAESTLMQYIHREEAIVARQARFGTNGRG